MLLYNASTEKQSVQAFGSWFTFAPGQIKMVEDRFGSFMSKNKRAYGIIELPEEFSDPSFKETVAGKDILVEKTLEGRTNRINFIKGVIHNEEVSLRMDLEKANLKINPQILANDNYVVLLKEYQGYKRADDDSARERVKEIQRIKSDLNKE